MGLRSMLESLGTTILGREPDGESRLEPGETLPPLFSHQYRCPRCGHTVLGTKEQVKAARREHERPTSVATAHGQRVGVRAECRLEPIVEEIVDSADGTVIGQRVLLARPGLHRGGALRRYVTLGGE